MDYANTTNVEFIVDPKVLFHGWLIYSYLQIFKLIKCKWLPGECADWFFDNIMTWSYCLYRRYSMSQQQNSILVNEHAMNREPVPLTITEISTLLPIKSGATWLVDSNWARKLRKTRNLVHFVILKQALEKLETELLFFEGCQHSWLRRPFSLRNDITNSYSKDFVLKQNKKESRKLYFHTVIKFTYSLTLTWKVRNDGGSS